ncbi:hypothetical protein [Nostoc sp.]|uniref:hypothetical protein n=1 Tax=Nostoc sp. TaxID=1180 RepID=UPI002FFB95EA
MTWVGNSAQIVDFLSSKPDHDVIIISGHGDERGLLLPELVEEIRSNYPYNDVICPEDFAQFLKLDWNIVVNASCMCGVQPLADVFLAGGAGYYIAPNNYLEGNASLMYLLNFLYEYMQNEQNVDSAHSASSAHSDDRRQFTLFKSSLIA